MRLDYPGLMKERLPSGAFRYRVRAEGDTSLKITLPCGPDDPRFREHYHAARQGRRIKPATITAMPGSIGWLVDAYTQAMPGLGLHPATIHQRTVFLGWLRGQRGEYAAAMPRAELVKLRDMKAETPGAADNFVKAVRAMYLWGIERGHVRENPGAGIRRIGRGRGARPWTLADLKTYRDHHPAGTMPHRALTLFTFAACRIGDAWQLGPEHEIEIRGQPWLSWQPAKRGSARVTIPMLPPLHEATRGCTGTYLKSEWGLPYASAAALGNAMRDWIEDAGLAGLSSHGIRKAAGELLALMGATQYHIMAVHGHTNAKTSEVYTRGVERTELAGQAMNLLRELDW